MLRVPNIKFNVAKMLQSMIPIVDSTVSILPSEQWWSCGQTSGCRILMPIPVSISYNFVVSFEGGAQDVDMDAIFVEC